jgi:hypothetical protein
MGELYQIVDYANTFENYKSKDIDRCGWFAHPNEMNIRWANVMCAAQGAACWAIFEAMLMVCSGQRKPRRGFLTHDGKADGQRYTISELAMMFYQTEDLVEYALKLLSKPEINWVKVVHAPDQTVQTPDQTVQTPDQLVQTPDQLVREVQASKTEQVAHAGLISPDAGPISPDAGPISQPRARVREPNGTEQKYPPSSPQGGDGGEPEFSIEDAKRWLNSFFPGRQREHWSREELGLLTDEVLPVTKADRALLSWAYKLPRNKEGWAVVQDRQLSKPKQSLLLLLREFRSEIDKWRTVRTNLNGARPTALDAPLSPEWVAAARNVYGPEWEPPPCLRLLPVSVEQDIREELVKHASAAA